MLASACRLERPGEIALSDRPIQVVATTSIIADLVRSIGGTRVSVEALMGPGVDPHLFKASAGDVGTMATADVVIYNGLHLEGKMGEIFEEMKTRGTPTIAIAELGVPDSLRRASPLFPGNYDPHIWFDVQLWTLAANALTTELTKLDEEHGDVYIGRSMQYIQELRITDDYIRTRITSISASSSNHV